MKQLIRSVLTVQLIVGMAAVAHAAAPEPAGKGAFQHDLLGTLGYTGKHVLELEDAIPRSKFNWRPGPGVRSIAEVYLHIAYSNYGLAKAATGKEPPADIGWEANPAKWDKKTTDKAEIKKILERSFAHVQEVVAAIPDADLDKKVSLFGMEMTTRAVLLVLVGHVNEHLGQEVAYARSNKIVPPWSEKTPGPKKAAAADSPAHHDEHAVAAKP
jgi:uncharacterized damage-inducible protein DinB